MTSGGWEIRTVSPAHAPLDTPTLVVIDGRFPEPVHVWFGEQPADLLAASPDRRPGQWDRGWLDRFGRVVLDVAGVRDGGVPDGLTGGIRPDRDEIRGPMACDRGSGE